MPPPLEYQNASLHFERFLVDARDNAGLATTNMAWNMVVGVLHAFRRRLSVKQVVQFAHVLPPVLRALFIEGWDVEAPPEPFASPEALLDEVRSVRREHNFSPDHAIPAVAAAVRKHVDTDALERILSTFAQPARDFWAPGQAGASLPPGNAA